ncbi:MAG: alpha/beta hydrolase family protein [Planctomycetales bacterium]
MPRCKFRLLIVAVLPVLLGLNSNAWGADLWPALPEADDVVALPAQEWPLRPGPRSVEVSIHYPAGRREQVTAETGLMLTLHNWGGTRCVGTADPRQLANRYNVVALCVDYLQSGDRADAQEPYDHGYLQALDALRALWWISDRLASGGKEFARGRVYCTGGSGGGNVALMCNKLAPRTFACAIDMCGMKKLTDDIAFHLPGESDLDARYRNDPNHPHFLSVDAQELRFVACPEHLEVMRRLGNQCRVIVVHGRDDTTCPFADAVELVQAFPRHGLAVEPHFLGKDQLDGQVFTGSGHALGDRTKIVFHVADRYLLPESPERLVRQGDSDFDRRDEQVRYRTSRGEYVISYREGFPVGRFEPAATPVPYEDHLDLSYRVDERGQKEPIRTPAEWEARRRQVLANLEQVMGPLPGPNSRVPLAVQLLEETPVDRRLIRRKLSYQSDSDDRVTAYLFVPDHPAGTKLPALLCLHQTTKIGKDEPAGLGGNPDLHYALELARRGFVTVAPDYPSFGEHPYDFEERHGYASGSMKAVWDNIRGVDYLQSLPEVDPARIGCVGHSLGGHSAIFTAVFDSRIQATVSSCGFTRFAKDDMPSWTGKNYMPRIATVYGNDARRVPFDFPELIAALAPRAFFASAATRDDDFDVEGVRETMTAAAKVYALYDGSFRLQEIYPETPHAFPPAAREQAYAWLEEQLK